MKKEISSIPINILLNKRISKEIETKLKLIKHNPNYSLIIYQDQYNDKFIASFKPTLNNIKFAVVEGKGNTIEQAIDNLFEWFPEILDEDVELSVNKEDKIVIK